MAPTEQKESWPELKGLDGKVNSRVLVERDCLPEF